jgi:hypothetical protein
MAIDIARLPTIRIYQAGSRILVGKRADLIFTE